MTDFDTPPGEVWAFCQTDRDGNGFWYRAGIGRLADEGRAIGKVNLTPFRNFTGDLMICPHGTEPPGAAPDPAFPLMRRAGRRDDQIPAALGLLCCFTRVLVKTGRGYYQGIGTGWFEPGDRARGKILLTDGQRIQHIAICPPGVKEPATALPLPVMPPRPRRSGEPLPDENSGDGEADETL
jgi:hypothetical protein